MSVDMDMIKEIPGYKVILKAVLKSQIQQLVEQLASYTDEESVILTASISDGTLSHLGSDSGKFFLVDHEDIKSQFLGFCLKRHHAKLTGEQLTPSPIGHPWQAHTGHDPGPSPRDRGAIPPSYRRKPSRHARLPGVKSVRHEPYAVPRQERRSLDSVNPGLDVNNSLIKDNHELNRIPGNLDASYDFLRESNSQNTGNLSISSIKVDKDGETNQNNVLDETIQDDVNVKQETMSEPDTDLEITGIELGGITTGGVNNSQGYQPLNTSQGFDPNQPLNTSQGYDPSQPLNTSQGFDSPGATGNAEDLMAQSSYDNWDDVWSAVSKTEENPSTGKFHCPLCRKGCSRKDSMVAHVRLHTGERPFVCDLCGRSFSKRWNMKSHRLTHKDVWEKQFNFNLKPT